MALPTELIDKLVKVTNDRGRGNTNYTVYGTIKTDGTRQYVQFDGSDISTPFETTVEVNPDDRVIVQVKNHIATVTGNTTNPSLGVKAANGLRSEISQTISQIRLEVADTVNGLKSSVNTTVDEIRLEVADTVNGLKSSVNTTVNEIRLEVSNTVSGFDSRITQNANAISGLVKGPEGYSELKQTFDALTFITENGVVKLSGGNIKLTGSISFSDLSDYSTVNNRINSAISDAEDAYDFAYDAYDTVDGWKHSRNGTYIDGRMIYSDSVYADSIHLGGSLAVYKTTKGTSVGGYLGYDSGFNSDSGIGIRESGGDGQVVCTNKAVRMSWGMDAQVFVDDTNVVMDATAIIFELNGTQYAAICKASTGAASNYKTFRPHGSVNMNLGESISPWANVYADTCTGSTSDQNKKNSIEDLPDKYIDLFDRLRPVRYKMNNGTSNRYHVGYIAQEVEAAMTDAGILDTEFAGFIRDTDENGNYVYMLRYGEFDAMRDAKIKQIEARLAAIEKRI
jgi:hypothetical protein